MTMRVYEFSKKFGIANKDLLQILKNGGFDIPSHMSTLSDEALEFLSDYFKKQQNKQEPPKQDALKISDKAGQEALPRVQTKPEIQEKQEVTPPKPQIKKVELEPKAEVVGIKREPMMVGDFAVKIKKPVSEVILVLLRQGIMATKNQIISEDTVEKLAKFYNVPILQPELPAEKELESVVIQQKEERIPVVVVIGHVDHGKTTLLDFIRKTRVAEQEKGGITQHLGAYQVHTEHGGLVFLDTPGHEAFLMMRARGVRVADVAILVVAADDGVMPQTIEAIKQAQLVNIPIVVAINKIDKASPAQIEKVKRDLTQHGLVPEEWGGQTVMMPISAKLGTGINELLEMVVLQTQLLELQTDRSMPGRGYVLESKIEKGLGPVATVICQYGTLALGDYFRAGSVYGKVSALIDSAGKRVKSVGPSTPVLVAGFSALPQAGDIFLVITAEELKRAKRFSSEPAQPQSFLISHEGKQVIRLILKADNASSLEALNMGISKIAKMLPPEQKIVVVQSGVGDINESDILFARDTHAIIYGFNVKLETKSTLLAAREKVIVRSFDIIYKLFEDIEQFAKESKIVRMIDQKLGTAEVLKVFKIKGVGVIAGAQVKSGRFVREGKVEIYRDKEKIGSGPIRSLQREKQTVKEVHSGFECAFVVEGFSDWQLGDIVECYIEVPEKQS